MIANDAHQETNLEIFFIVLSSNNCVKYGYNSILFKQNNVAQYLTTFTLSMAFCVQFFLPSSYAMAFI
jgi:hypothetical protein